MLSTHKLLLICSFHIWPWNIGLTIGLFSQNGFAVCPLERVPKHHKGEHGYVLIEMSTALRLQGRSSSKHRRTDSRLRQRLSTTGNIYDPFQCIYSYRLSLILMKLVNLLPMLSLLCSPVPLVPLQELSNQVATNKIWITYCTLGNSPMLVLN